MYVVANKNSLELDNLMAVLLWTTIEEVPEAEKKKRSLKFRVRYESVERCFYRTFSLKLEDDEVNDISIESGYSDDFRFTLETTEGRFIANDELMGRVESAIKDYFPEKEVVICYSKEVDQ